MSERLYPPDGESSVAANDPTAEAVVQEFCDRAHQWLIANNPTYAEQVALGHTLRWDTPHRSGSWVRGQGFVSDGKGWYMNYDNSMIHDAFTYTERLLVVPALNEDPPA